METINEEIPKMPAISFWEKNKIIIKGIVIGILILVMLLPKSFVDGLISERKARQEQVIKETNFKWAQAQTISGPVLLVPYLENVKGKDGKIMQERRNAYFLPEKLEIQSKILPEKRHRSLFEVTLYKSISSVNGSFALPNMEDLQIAKENVLWNEAQILLHISDPRGLEDEVIINWNGTPLKLNPGVPQNDLWDNGMNAKIPAGQVLFGDFSIKLQMKGSEKLNFLPLGKVTNVAVTSPWKTPASDGNYLPVNAPVVDQNGFSAHWKIMEVSRSFPQSWKNGKQPLDEAAFGISLLDPTNEYVQTERSSKYAILFIGLTFAVFFLMEIVQKKQVHPFQYILVGMALIIFYTLLLSFSEYIGFNISYWVAAVATIALIGLYVKSIFQKGRIAFFFTLALGGLYGYIYFLIQLEDYALLCGSIGLFVILALIMYATRNVNWYAMRKLAA